MDKNILGTNLVAQVALVVNDIEKTSQMYADFFGVEKPGYVVTGTYEETKTEFRGSPSKARAKLAFFHVGPNLTIELIEPDHEPSTWREELDKNGEGFHHIAFRIENTKEKLMVLDRNNMPMIQYGSNSGGSYAYVDAKKDLKVILELLEKKK